MAITWAGQRLTIEEIERQWREPDGPAFRVRTTNTQRFELRYNEHTNTWLVRQLDQPPQT